MNIDSTLSAQNTFSAEFTPAIGRFQAAADARSKVTLQMRVNKIGWKVVATLHVVDAGTVNNVGGYSENDTVMITSGLSGDWAEEQWFIVAGDTVLHRVTDFTAGTLVTFTPGLGANVIDTAVITRVIPSANGISIQEQVDDDVRWRIGIVTGDYAMETHVRIGQAQGPPRN